MGGCANTCNDGYQGRGFQGGCGQGRGGCGNNGGNSGTDNCFHNQAENTKAVGLIQSSPLKGIIVIYCIYRNLIYSIQGAHGRTSRVLCQTKDGWIGKDHPNYDGLD